MSLRDNKHCSKHMPNWCESTIYITGTPSNVKAVAEKLRVIEEKDSLLFEGLIGKDFQGTEEEFENGGWYEHNNNRYGTKWDVKKSQDGMEWTIGNNSIVIPLNTAWSPPEIFCHHLAELYCVNVRIEFYEAGNCFAGISEFNNLGEIVIEETYDYEKGLYIIDKDYFFMEQVNYLEYELQELEGGEELNIDEYIKQKNFDLLFTSEDRERLLECLEEAKQNLI